jgi:VRR-NUC domain
MSGIATASVWTRNVARRRHDEDDLQRAIMRYLDEALGADGVAYAIPNGGKRHAREAARMKGLGVRAGVPDIGICYRGRALYVELKAPRGVLSAAQKEMQRRLNYAGGEVMLCRSIEDCERALRECGVHLRASVTA